MAMALAGCGEKAEPSDKMDPSETSDLTLDELFSKTAAASEEASSFHMDMVTNQTMEMGPGMGEMDMEMDVSMDMTLEPVAFYQKAASTFVTEGMEDMPAMETEMYYTADGMFSYDPMMEAWIKLPVDEMQELEALMMEQQSGDLSGQLEQLEAFRDDFTFEQSGDEFILTLDAAGEEYEKLISEEMGMMLGDLDVEVQEIMDGITINKIHYEIFVDKDTFQPNAINVTMDYDMEMEGESVNIQSDVQSEYSNFNGVEAITVPVEVLEQAEEI